MEERAHLLARSCTTGWTDWVHGDLLLLPTALLRRRTGWLRTIGNTPKTLMGRTVSQPLSEAQTVDRGRVLITHRTNKVIDFYHVADARLFRGITTHGLTAHMTDGQRHTLLWLAREPATDILHEVLTGALGNRLSTR